MAREPITRRRLADVLATSIDPPLRASSPFEVVVGWGRYVVLALAALGAMGLLGVLARGCR